MQLQEIINTIKRLPKNELKSFFKWVEEYKQKIWDNEFEEDVKSGKLDKLAEEAIKDFKTGKCREL